MLGAQLVHQLIVQLLALAIHDTRGQRELGLIESHTGSALELVEDLMDIRVGRWRDFVIDLLFQICGRAQVRLFGRLRYQEIVGHFLDRGSLQVIELDLQRG